MLRIQRITDRLFDPIDIAPLVFFRIGFGAIMLWEVWRYFNFDRIFRYYVEPTFFFHYYGFDWVKPLPGDGMFWLFHGLGVLSVLIMLGAFYRLSMTLFWLAFTYVFLLDQTQYLNHFYLISLVSFLLIFVPAHRALSLDAWWRPALRAQVAPAWSLWLLRGQMAVVYVGGGLAKINADWLAGEPMRMWLADRTDFPLIGGLFTQEWVVYVFSYGGLLLDLFIVPLLLWPRTRIPALLLALVFHLTNSRLFNIGVFPWFAIAATLIFLPPHWFRPATWRAWWQRRPVARPDTPRPAAYTRRRGWILAALAVYFAVQIWLPLRHWLYPGDPSWTEEGHNLAWHMRLRDKGGDIAFFASDPATSTTWRLPVENHLSSRQFSKMKDNPHMILRLAHHLGRELEAAGYAGVQIRVWSMITLNNRASQLLLDPTADLVQAPDHLLAADWILPLVQLPYPQATQPALLISRRQADTLLLVNITERPYPLAQLALQAGEVRVTGADFGMAALQPGECLLAHTAAADLSAFFAPCNEADTRLLIAPELAQAALQVSSATGQVTCTNHTCIITDTGESELARSSAGES